MANALPEPDAIISLCAYSADPPEHGFVVAYPSPPLRDSLGDPTARLAEAMRDQLVKADIPPANGVDGFEGRGGLALLNLAQFPAVQVELANFNNSADAAKAETPEGRQQFADAVVRGIASYLATKPR